MASSSSSPVNVKRSPEENNKNPAIWLLANKGIKMLINNNSKGAEELFGQYPDELVMFAGNSFVVFMESVVSRLAYFSGHPVDYKYIFFNLGGPVGQLLHYFHHIPLEKICCNPGDALMSFDGDKLDTAVSTLKEVEQRCNQDSGWVKSFQKMFSSGNQNARQRSLADQLETQIILADSQVCIATLTFLQQDISGYLKGGWVLRKAWKVYQKAYKEISELYKQKVGELHLPDPLESPMPLSDSEFEVSEYKSVNGYLNPKSKIPYSRSDVSLKTRCSNPSNMTGANSLHNYNDPYKIYNYSINNDGDSIENDSDSLKNDHDSVKNYNDAIKNGNDSMKNDSDSMKNDHDSVKNNDDFIKNDSDSIKNDSDSVKHNGDSIKTDSSFIKNNRISIKNRVESIQSNSNNSGKNFSVCNNSTSAQTRPYSVPGASYTSSKKCTRPRTLKLKKSISVNNALSDRDSKQNFWSTSRFSPLNSSFSLSNFSSPVFQLFSSEQMKQDIDQKTIIRLMGAISFGYGLFQLGVSLLPPSLTRVVSLLGFGANRENGISCLMYARLGVDMRAPLATLALLWYHTIVRPFYAIDGTNVQAGLESANMLLKESEREFAESALFLFFKGRALRLNSDIPGALQCYQQAVENATQREIKLLALHEVGWCHLIELDFPNADSIFSYMKTSSRWSRVFYGYMAAICGGAYRPRSEWSHMEEVNAGLEKNVKIGQLDEFLARRAKVFPTDPDGYKKLENIFWRLLVFEMIYLWNSLASCNHDNIQRIIKDCQGVKSMTQEPMAGLSKLLLGACYSILKKYDKAIENFRECLKIRKSIPNNANDAHVSAFAHFELGNLLIKKSETKIEGKTLLQQIGQYSRYDFEPKLTVRVHYVLKNL